VRSPRRMAGRVDRRRALAEGFRLAKRIAGMGREPRLPLPALCLHRTR